MGVSAALLAGQGDVAEGLSEFLEPWMKRLSRETGEAASAFVLGDGLARIITFQPGTYALTIHFPKRIWHDVLSLATGRLLVAELPEYEWPQFISDENRTGKSKWTSLLREIHRVGYCICWHPEQLAMAFPVRNRFGRIMFAVGASAPVSRATPDQCALMFTSIRKIACDLSQGFECPNKLLKTLAITALPDGEIESFQNPNIG